MYMSSIGDVISQHNVEYHQYADDMPVSYTHLTLPTIYSV